MNLAVLGLLARAGAGADIVSGGELYRALRRGSSRADRLRRRRQDARGDPPGAEGGHPALQRGVGGGARGRRRGGAAEGMRARVALSREPRRRPQDPPVHRDRAQDDKFGIPYRDARGCTAGRGPAGRRGRGRAHATSARRSPRSRPFPDAVGAGGRAGRRSSPARASALALPRRRRRARDPLPRRGARRSPGEYGAALAGRSLERMGPRCCWSRGGRSSATRASLLTRVLYVKAAGGKTLRGGRRGDERPGPAGALRRAPRDPAGRPRRADGAERDDVDVVGPVCESGDFLAGATPLPASAEATCWPSCRPGAYGFAMASNYNARPRAAEVLVDGDRFQVVRRRESYEDMVNGETPWTGPLP